MPASNAENKSATKPPLAHIAGPQTKPQKKPEVETDPLKHDGLTFASPEARALYLESRRPSPPPSQSNSEPPPKKGKTYPLWVQVVVGGIGGLFFMSWLGGGSGGSSSNTSGQISQLDAIFLCQTALKAASRDPERADVPYVEGKLSGNEYYFAWGNSTRPVRMRNGFGIEVAAGASCFVDRNSRKVTGLTLDGKSIL